jgi:hypothetical protein
MGVFLGITKGMMIPMHGRVSKRVKKRRALKNVSQDIKKLFPRLTHTENFMRSVPVQKKGLEK